MADLVPVSVVTTETVDEDCNHLEGFTIPFQMLAGRKQENPYPLIIRQIFSHFTVCVCLIESTHIVPVNNFVQSCSDVCVLDRG